MQYLLNVSLPMGTSSIAISWKSLSNLRQKFVPVQYSDHCLTLHIVYLDDPVLTPLFLKKNSVHVANCYNCEDTVFSLTWMLPQHYHIYLYLSLAHLHKFSSFNVPVMSTKNAKSSKHSSLSMWGKWESRSFEYENTYFRQQISNSLE